jgi:hypothetical protein
MNNTEIFILLLIAAVMTIAIIRIAQNRQPGYQTRTNLLSSAELHFLRSLEAAVPLSIHIAWKVRLADVIEVHTSAGAKTRAQRFNRISSKHVDFVLCDRATSAIQCAIELNDRSHMRPERQRRDRFVREALKGAGIPLIEIPCSRGYDANRLREQLQVHTGTPSVPQRILSTAAR